MTPRITLALWAWAAPVLLAAAPALAQPARPVAPRPPAPTPTADDLAAFDKDLDALFQPSGLTAAAAASRAAAASPSVRRKVAELEASVAQVDAAELTRVPVASGKLSYTRLSAVDPATVTVAGMSFQIAPSLVNSTLAEAQLVVPLSDYVLRFPKVIDAARLGAEVAQLGKRSTEIGAGQDARLAYYEWVRSKLQVLIARRQLLQVQKTLGQVRALAEVQRLSKADLLRVESQEAQAEQVLDQLDNLSQLREEQLRLLIGAAAGEPLAIGEDIRGDLAGATPAALDDLLGSAKRQRLEFKVIDAGIQAKDKQREAELANQLPRLAAVAVADYADPNQRIFPQHNAFDLTWAIGAQLTWTLNDALVSRATERRITAEASQLRADRENLERGTRVELLAAQQAVAVAQHALATSQKGLVAAEEGYRVRKELLSADRATAVELIDAETDLTRARIAALNARVDLRVAIAQLTHALGNDAAAK
jgi:outer membrane protein